MTPDSFADASFASSSEAHPSHPTLRDNRLAEVLDLVGMVARDLQPEGALHLLD